MDHYRPIRQTTYRGFSTVRKSPITKLYDVDLVKQDLLNHFNISKNERCRDADYGSLLPDMVFELDIDYNIQSIVNEVIRIIETEERVRLINYTVVNTTHSVSVDCELHYVGLEVQEIFKINFDLNTKLVTEVIQ